MKTLRWKYLLLLSVLSVVFAIANNLRQTPEKRVDWVGGQEVLKTPEEAP